MKKPNILTYLRLKFGKSKQEKEWDSHLEAIRDRMLAGIENKITIVSGTVPGDKTIKS